MPGKIAKLAVLAGAASGAALLFVSSPGPVSSHSPLARTPAGTAEADRPRDENRFYRPEAGFRYVYGFRRKISFAGDLGGATMAPVGFGGELYVDVLRADDRAFEAVVSERVQGAPVPRAPFARIEADARGDNLSFFRAENLAGEELEHVSVVKDLVSLWLFPLRSDTVGPFDARFEPESNGEKKTKLAYLSRAPNTPAVLSSEHHLLWDSGLHLPKEVKGIETTRLGNGKSALTAESRYELLFRSRERAPDYGRSLLAGLREEDTLALDTSRAPNLAEHPDYKNLDWGKILADLGNIASLPNMQQLSVFGDVLKFLRLHPERVADLAALLRDPALLKAGAASAEFKTIVGALASFGSTEAYAALREAYASPELAGPGKETILAALTTTQAPSDSATRDFLAKEMQSGADPRLAQGAAFALGSALQSAVNDPQSAAAIAMIEDRFQSASSTRDKLAFLDVMGNSGRAEFLPTLEGVLSGDASPNVKAKAEFALRFIKTAGPDLLQGLASKDDGIREAAAAGLGIADWSETFRAPLEACSAGDTVSRIQSSCRATLASHPRVAGGL